MSRVRLLFLCSAKFAVCLGLVSLLALSGCSSIKVKLGMRISLAKTPVTSMEVSQYQHPGIGPGEKSSLVATFTQPDGKILVTEGKGKGKVLWKDLAVVATVVSVNKKGVVTLPKDPRVSDGKTGHVSITVPSHPGVSAELDIPLRYDYNFVSTFAGSSGQSGMNGTNGTDGMSGSMGSLDPNNPSAGGDGTNGSNGTDGTNGWDGRAGPAVQVRAALRAGSHPLLQVGVTSAGHKERFYLVDPQGGSMTVKSDGGAGGAGARVETEDAAGQAGSGRPTVRMGATDRVDMMAAMDLMGRAEALP